MSVAVTRIRIYSHKLARLATITFALLFVAICWEFLTILMAGDRQAEVKFSLIYRLPATLYLWAIWIMRNAFHSLANGALFDSLFAKRLGLTGCALAAGAFVTILPMPLLLRYTFGSHIGGIANFDVSAIMLGIVGMMLILLARLLAQAAQMRAELDEFF